MNGILSVSSFCEVCSAVAKQAIAKQAIARHQISPRHQLERDLVKASSASA